MGFLVDANHPEVQSAVVTVETKVLEAKRVLGTVSPN